MDRSIAVAVSNAGAITVSGVFQRHTSPRQRPLTGSAAGGRWGAEGAYPVLYLARPTDSVIVEAYRHLVEPIEGMKPEMVGPRRLVTCKVEVSHVLDLRIRENRDAVGLSIVDMTSDVGDYAACHRVSRAAHQLELHGIIAQRQPEEGRHCDLRTPSPGRRGTNSPRGGDLGNTPSGSRTKPTAKPDARSKPRRSGPDSG